MPAPSPPTAHRGPPRPLTQQPRVLVIDHERRRRSLAQAVLVSLAVTLRQPLQVDTTTRTRAVPERLSACVLRDLARARQRVEYGSGVLGLALRLGQLVLA